MAEPFIQVEMARLEGRRRVMLSKARVPTDLQYWKAGPFGGVPSDGRFEFTVRRGTHRIISRVLVTRCDGRTVWRTMR